MARTDQWSSSSSSPQSDLLVEERPNRTSSQKNNSWLIPNPLGIQDRLRQGLSIQAA
jgi:hypothetical protein